jgi:hypothetical protein
MALVHSRVRRVVYGCGNTSAGAFGVLVDKRGSHFPSLMLHGVRALNHRYQVCMCAIAASLGSGAYFLCVLGTRSNSYLFEIIVFISYFCGLKVFCDTQAHEPKNVLA